MSQSPDLGVDGPVLEFEYTITDSFLDLIGKGCDLLGVRAASPSAGAELELLFLVGNWR